MKHPQVRRARKLGEAVFRGSGAIYTFDVFPLTIDIRDSGAVFIISRRITDRFRSGHHRTICIGECSSIVSEIKKHKRAKCAKTFEANSVCILRDEDRKARLRVIEDLVAARTFECVMNVAKPMAKPLARNRTQEKDSKTRKAATTPEAPTLPAGKNKRARKKKTDSRSKAVSLNGKPAKRSKSVQPSKVKAAKQKKSNVVTIASRSKAKKNPSPASRKRAA